MENNLPEGWVYTELDKISEIVQGQSPPSSTYNFDEIGLPFFQGKTEFTDLYPIVRKWCSEPSKIAQPNDILLSVRAPVGPTNIANQISGIGRGLAAIRYKPCYRYVFYYLRKIEKELEEQATGSTFSSISGEVVRNIIVPLAPLAEQQRIVIKLDVLMKKVENNKQRLEKIPALLKRFRQSVLAAAVSGKLTKDWREAHSTQESAKAYIDRVKVKDYSVEQVESDVPDSWISVRIGDVFDIVRGSSPRPKSEKRFFSKEKTPFNWIMLSDFTDNTKNDVLMATNEYLTEAGTKYSRYVDQNDVIVGVSGMYGVGRTCLLNIHGYIYDGIMAIKGVKDDSMRKFINYFMQLQRMKLMDVATGTSWPNITTTILKEYVFPIPPPEEQKEIVRRVEELFAFADKIEARYAKAKALLDKLPQSILAKAFRGELVLQNPNDEPASALLERINKEKETQNIVKRKKKSIP